MIDIQPYTHEDVRVLTLAGKLNSKAEEALWKAVQKEVVENGERKLVLDFSAVPECDSYGISELLRLHRSIDNIGGKMVISSVNDLIQKVFAITKVNTVFHLAATLPEAIASLSGPDLKPA